MLKFSIIIPTAAEWNDAASLGLYGTPVHQWVSDMIVAQCGGLTRSLIHGVWKGPQGIVAEAGFRLDFASQHDLTEFVRSTANYIATHTNEMCVYVEHGGEAHIIGDL